MDPKEISARLAFLDDSAHMLAATAPATARYMMSTHNALMFETHIEPTESQMRRACGACGTIMILGWDASLELCRKGKCRQRVEAADKQIKTMVYNCGTCSRKTRISTGTSKPSARHGKSISNSLSNPRSISTQAVSQPITTATTSKRRNRPKSKGGLAAILAKNHASQASQSSSSGFGLDLLDFMKKD
ncbi:RNAse P Rpr2/Rpp21/SNM1 subunit domain-containing protein [Diplocarpon rosae]|nr:RNAse P Rpr2/Rpp21/SNM1 subunit domain-containing protein [Diplocarpon rosae]